MRDFLQGATMLASFAVAVFFLRYWRQTRDRLFGVFAAAFALFGINRILLAILDDDSEARTWVYALRALMFIAIIVAIIDKNLSRRPERSSSQSPWSAAEAQPEHDDIG